MCGSPKLIAACHVLHRLFLPRHPPCALSSLTIELTLAQEPELALQFSLRSFYVIAACALTRPERPEETRYPKDTQLIMTHRPAPQRDQAEAMLSLVIFFTQSISLSNISQTPACFASVHPGVDLSRSKTFTIVKIVRPRKAQSPQELDLPL